MALHADAQVNGTSNLSSAEEKDLYSQLLRLRDAVIDGNHPHIKLPPAIVEQLKASLTLLNAPSATVQQPSVGGVVNGKAFDPDALSTNGAQQSAIRDAPYVPGLPGLQTLQNSNVRGSVKQTSSGGLDPIFLQKSDVVVRAEGQLKRQRIERELQTQLDQRRPGADKGSVTTQDLSPLDVDAILLSSAAREGHVSGLKLARAATPASSFDTNDYYSSQVESEWSSPASAVKNSVHAAGANTTDFERPGGPNAFSSFAKSHGQRFGYPRDPRERLAHLSYPQGGHVNAGGDEEDDEYTPPDAAAFDGVHDDYQPTLSDPQDASDYEPGEITQGTHASAQMQQTAQPSPHVPIIRNHLTHIAAPQPSRVSPLAVAKRPSIELELVNGRPEVVKRDRLSHHGHNSRASTASPGNGTSNTNKKMTRREKKRKREAEATARGKKRKREKQGITQIASSTGRQEPRIKDEPISPPPFAQISDVPPYSQAYQNIPAEIDLISPRHGTTQARFHNEPLSSQLRYEYPEAAPPAVVRLASPTVARPVQREHQDLRRVASLHNAQRPLSPSYRAQSAAAHRTVSFGYGDPRLQTTQFSTQPQYVQSRERPTPQHVQYIRSERSQSPPASSYDPYARVRSPAVMPPPPTRQRKIVVDQYGNQYYATETAATPAPVSRASLVPVDRRAPSVQVSDRPASRIGAIYSQPAAAAHFEPTEMRMAPPAVPRRPAEGQAVQYIDNNGYFVRDYSTQPTEPVRYGGMPPSPVQQATRYEQMPPPPMPHWPATSPVYGHSQRSSVWPEEAASQSVGYAPRQASVAPIQYVMQEGSAAPTRPMSVAVSHEPAPAGHPSAYSQAPQRVVQYVDQYGRPVYPGEFRHMSNY